MPLTHVPLECVADAREARKSSRRRLLGTAAASGALVAGALTLRKAQPAAAQQLSAQETRSFSTVQRIDINSANYGNPAPSRIQVSGLRGRLIGITVRLNGYRVVQPPDNIGIMLQSPGGTGKVILYGVGGTSNQGAVNLTISDSALVQMPVGSTLSSQHYLPTNTADNGVTAGLNFPPIGGVTPSTPTPGENLAAFNNSSGANLNGTWFLWVRDFTDPPNNVSGEITSWSMTIVTDVNPPVIRNDNYSVKAGETLTVRRPGILENDLDPTGGGVRVSKVIRRSNRLGRLTVKRNGALTFVARRNVSGRFRFRYRAISRSGLHGTARVTIRVTR